MRFAGGVNEERTVIAVRSRRINGNAGIKRNRDGGLSGDTCLIRQGRQDIAD
jgi:hypothetical protein